jgi:preprotein translocase subunit SecA
MLNFILKRFAGRHYRKFIERCKPIVATIRDHEARYQQLSDEELRQKTNEFKERYQAGESIDKLLPEAFAVVQSAARRLCGQTLTVCGQELQWNMVHYDVQLIGGIALHQKKIAEMGTGEGKTMVATLPLYLNALTGKNCQLITVNDYLVKRDAEWMGYLYRFLELTVGYLQSGMDTASRREAYQCDITYGTASEFGFDYLRDNGLASTAEEQVQRGHFFCIIDEADSILIDEARTPLIISGPVEETVDAPFRQLKSSVEYVIGLQQKLCNRLLSEAKSALEGNKESAQEAVSKLYQVHLGMPKNRQFLKLMEEGSYRKQFERFSLELMAEYNKEKLYYLKEELYFTIDEKHQQADLTEKGRNTLKPNDPEAFVLPDLPLILSQLHKRTDLPEAEKVSLRQAAEERFSKVSEEIYCLSQLLRAYCLYEKDVHYVVQEGKVVIVDENTGRAMHGRRWSEGLHQAVEAKEGVEIEKETKTFATITLQNYFRLYQKLGGMTGTAETEASEFHDIYGLSVMAIPPHKPCIRKDFNDVIYKTRREKYKAIISDVAQIHQTGQPVLLGTTSIEASELLSKMLKSQGISHNVLNAKLHQKEAEIVAHAGQKGIVTIATNMAGRGTDIKLGEGVAALGGLFVVGSERHESRRIDRQLRGRCARQGDPGASRFYVSLEDDLMRLFASQGPIANILHKTFKEGEQLEHPLLNRSNQAAQKRVEQQNYSVRKRLLQYDNVLNKQREIIYGMRQEVLHAERPKKILFEMIEEEVQNRLEAMNERGNEHSNQESYVHWINTYFPVAIKTEEIAELNQSQVYDFVIARIHKAYEEKEQLETLETISALERHIIIRALDHHWVDHLTEMEALRQSVSLRSYGQKDPLSEYKSEAFVFFKEMMARVRNDLCLAAFRLSTSLRAKVKSNPNKSITTEPEANAPVKNAIQFPGFSVKTEVARTGRNDACPCGSNKKYKKCCGSEG